MTFIVQIKYSIFDLKNPIASKHFDYLISINMIAPQKQVKRFDFKGFLQL